MRPDEYQVVSLIHFSDCFRNFGRISYQVSESEVESDVVFGEVFVVAVLSFDVKVLFWRGVKILQTFCIFVCQGLCFHIAVYRMGNVEGKTFPGKEETPFPSPN